MNKQIWNPKRLMIYTNSFYLPEDKSDAIGYSCIIYDVLGKDIHELYTCDFSNLKFYFGKIMQNFSKDQLEIIKLRYGLDGYEPHSIYEISEMLNNKLTENEIMNLIKNSKAKFKEYLIADEQYMIICKEVKLRKRIKNLENEYERKKEEFSHKLSRIEIEIDKTQKELELLFRASYCGNPDKWLKPISKREIDDCNFSVRIRNALYRAGFETVEDITNFTEKDLLKVKSLGKSSVEIIKKFLTDNSLSLKEE